MSLPSKPRLAGPVPALADASDDALRPSKGQRERRDSDLPLAALEEDSRIAIDGRGDDHAFAELRVLDALAGGYGFEDGLSDCRHQEIRWR